jgi:hypothetical protein
MILDNIHDVTTLSTILAVVKADIRPSNQLRCILHRRLKRSRLRRSRNIQEIRKWRLVRQPFQPVMIHRVPIVRDRHPIIRNLIKTIVPQPLSRPKFRIRFRSTNQSNRPPRTHTDAQSVIASPHDLIFPRYPRPCVGDNIPLIIIVVVEYSRHVTQKIDM